MEKHYMKWPFDRTVLSERRYGFAVKAAAVQYDVSGEPCVLVVQCDGFGDFFAEIKAGRAYLHPVRITLVGELEPGVVVIRSNRLRNGMFVFRPGDVQPLGPDYAQRFARGEFEVEPAGTEARS
jgi:hypothetical protein